MLSEAPTEEINKEEMKNEFKRLKLLGTSLNNPKKIKKLEKIIH